MGAKRNNIKSKFLSYFKSPNGYDLHKEEKNKTSNEKRFMTRASTDHRRQSTYRQKLNIENINNQTFPFHALVTKQSTNKSIPVVVHGVWSFDYAECLTEGSKIVPVILNLDKPIMYTQINNKLTFETVHDVQEYKKIEDITWLVVTQRFLYNSKSYEPGEILEINNRSKLKNLFNSFSKNNKKNELNVVSHPKQDRSSLPLHLKGNFRICDSPYTSCYRLLSDLVNSIEPPLLITLPINTNTGEVMCQGKVSFTKHNKRLLVTKKSTMNILFVSQENDERIGLLNLSKRDHIEISECNNDNVSQDKENQNFELIKQRALKNLKLIFDSKDVFYFDEKAAQPTKAPKRKSFKAASFIKRRRSNTETVEMRNTVNGHNKRKEVTSLILTESTSLSHSIFKSLKRFSYHPPSELYKAPSYRELLEKIDHYKPDEKQLSVRDRNGYLVPVTGFSPDGKKVREFVNSMEELYRKDSSDIDDVEVGDDGYVLVTPSKKKIPGNSKKDTLNKSLGDKQVMSNEKEQNSNMKNGSVNYADTFQQSINTDSQSNLSVKGTSLKAYVSNDIYQNKCLINDVNKNSIVMKPFEHNKKPQLLPKPSTLKITSQTHSSPRQHEKHFSALFSKQENTVNVSNQRKISTVSISNGKIVYERRPVLQTKRFSAIIDRFEKLSGSTDKLSYC